MYYKIIGIVIGTVGTWGFMLPFLVSLPITEMVVLGVVLGIAYFPITWKVIVSLFKDMGYQIDGTKQNEKEN